MVWCFYEGTGMKNILVSACLLGGSCRYDGRSKPNEEVLRLLEDENVCLIPICPEQMGGLSTPRFPSERQGDRVINSEGEDVTVQYRKGAEEALKLAELYHCRLVILKERSPSCGSGAVYDGTFSGTLTDGDGVTAELLKMNRITVLGESELQRMKR